MKYRQPGYRDDERQHRPDRESYDERVARQEARKTRHGVSRDVNVVVRCTDCGHQTAIDLEIAFDTTCERCQMALHTCHNCRFFDTAARFRCRQPIPERMPSTTAANTCDLYEARTVLDSTGKRAKEEEHPRSAFDALFKD